MPLFSQSGFGSGRYGIADNGPIYVESISYYLAILTSEYKLAPRLNAWLPRLLQKPDDVTTCILNMVGDFVLGAAAGPTLDILGAIVGQVRTVGFQPSGGVSPVLDDSTYTLLLEARIAQNNWNGQIGSLQPTWANLFPGGRITVIDNQNMSATIALSGSFSSITKDLIDNGYIVPRPQAVEYTYTFPELPAFGTDENNSFIAGLDTGHIT